MADNVNNNFAALTGYEIADFIDGTNLLGRCIKQIMNVFSFVRKYFRVVKLWKFKFADLVEWNFHISPHENICTIALINIHYLLNIT